MARYLLQHGANAKRALGLDAGVEGIEPCSMRWLASFCGPRVQAILEAELDAAQAKPDPIENAWVTTAISAEAAPILIGRHLR